MCLSPFAIERHSKQKRGIFRITDSNLIGYMCNQDEIKYKFPLNRYVIMWGVPSDYFLRYRNSKNDVENRSVKSVIRWIRESPSHISYFFMKPSLYGFVSCMLGLCCWEMRRYFWDNGRWLSLHYYL